MISQDLGMRAVLKDVELLVYTSNILPQHCWSKCRNPLLHVLFNEHKLDFLIGTRFRLIVFRLLRNIKSFDLFAEFQERFYLWGVFRAKQTSHVTSVVGGEEKNLVKASTRDSRSPISPLSDTGSSRSC